jgi:hypothetical protein
MHPQITSSKKPKTVNHREKKKERPATSAGKGTRREIVGTRSHAHYAKSLGTTQEAEDVVLSGALLIKPGRPRK